jgi:ELWxxDGT repeat protein
MGSFADVDGLLFFFINSGSSTQLWTSDASGAGTVQVATIPVAVDLSKVVAVDDLLFFAHIGENSAQLWRSDGTTAGTFMVREFHEETGPATGAMDAIGSMIAFGGKLFLSADEGGLHGTELWRSDGTVAGTTLVKEINENEEELVGVPPGEPGALFRPIGSQPHSFEIYNGLLYFFATTVTYEPLGNNYGYEEETELWRTDGTSDGTVQAVEVHPGYGQTGPGVEDATVAAGGTLFFSYNTDFDGIEIWKTNGTQVSLQQVTQIKWPGGYEGIPIFLGAANDRVFFYMYGGDFNAPTNGIWATDGSATGTVHVANKPPLWTVELNGRMYFAIKNGDVVELLSSNGTLSGTSYLAVLGHNVTANEAAVVHGKIYYAGHFDGPASSNFELRAVDGSGFGSYLVSELKPGSGGSQPQNLKNIGGNLFFTADDGTHGRELYTIRHDLPPTDAPGEYGDFTGDNVVDSADYIIWRKNQNKAVAPFTLGDVDGNGFVDQIDYDAWRANFGLRLTIGDGGAGASAAFGAVAGGGVIGLAESSSAAVPSRANSFSHEPAAAVNQGRPAQIAELPSIAGVPGKQRQRVAAPRGGHAGLRAFESDESSFDLLISQLNRSVASRLRDIEPITAGVKQASSPSEQAEFIDEAFSEFEAAIPHTEF